MPVTYGDQSYSEAFVMHASPEHSFNLILIFNGFGLDALAFSLYTQPFVVVRIFGGIIGISGRTHEDIFISEK